MVHLGFWASALHRACPEWGGLKRLLKRNAKPSSRRALAAVCAADSSGHNAHRSSMQGFARWPEFIAALTAASALRLEGR